MKTTLISLICLLISYTALAEDGISNPGAAFSERRFQQSRDLHDQAAKKIGAAYAANTEALVAASKAGNRELVNELRRERAFYSQCYQQLLESILEYNLSVPDCVNEL